MRGPLPVLIVDDEPVVRESLAAWISEDGYAVDAVASGEEAVERAAARDHLAFLVDLKMPPGIDGIETMRRFVKDARRAGILIHGDDFRVRKNGFGGAAHAAYIIASDERRGQQGPYSEMRLVFILGH